MKAVVLAAGLGKRLAAITVDKPKVLVKIGEKTLIEHNLNKLRKLGINKIALVTGYKGEMVKQVIGNVVAYYEQKEQLGKGVQRLLSSLGLEFRAVDPRKCAEILSEPETRRLQEFF